MFWKELKLAPGRQCKNSKMCFRNNPFAPIHVSSVQFEAKKLEPAPTSAQNDDTQQSFLKQ